MSEGEEILEQVVREDSRYHLEAYLFVNRALQFLQESLPRRRHVSGQELLEGIRVYALREYGPLSREVFNRWGVLACRDFGEIVFNLVERNLLGKTEQDRREDFSAGYDFEAAFETPLLRGGENG